MSAASSPAPPRSPRPPGAREPDVPGFLRRFTAFGAAPSAASYLPLFAPDATLFDSGMARPIGVAEIGAHIEGVLRVAPDFRMTPERWRHRDRTLFVEAHNRATLAGRPARWRSVYCVDLAGDRVTRGRRYYDRRPLYARLSPDLPALPAHRPEAREPGDEAPPPLPDPDAPLAAPRDLARAVAAAWAAGRPESLAHLYRDDGCLASAGLERPLSRAEIPGWYRSLAPLVARLDVLGEAGDDTLAFLEWRLSARVGDATLALGGVDRFDLAGGRILHARAYFDTLELAAALAAAAGGGSR